MVPKSYDDLFCTTEEGQFVTKNVLKLGNSVPRDCTLEIYTQEIAK